MTRIVKAGTTSKTIAVFIQDSSSTTGAGLTGLTYASAGLTAYYALPKAAPVAITLVTLAAVTTAWTSGGFIAIDGTNMPGWYRLDVPNAAFASGDFVGIHLRGATNMAPLPVGFQLVAYDPQDTVRLGLTSLPNAAAGATGGLATVDANNSVKIQSGVKKNTAIAYFRFSMTLTGTSTPATGKAGTMSVKRGIDSGAQAAGTLGTITEIAGGEYYTTFAAADTNGTCIMFQATESSCNTVMIPILTDA